MTAEQNVAYGMTEEFQLFRGLERVTAMMVIFKTEQRPPIESDRRGPLVNLQV